MTLPGLVTRNLRLKAVAAVLATVTWAGVVYASNPPDTRSVTVKVPQDDAALSPYVLVHPIPDLVVRISGTRDHLDTFVPADLVILVNYHAITRAGIQAIPVTVVNNDRDVQLDNVPTTVAAEVDQRASRSITVTMDIAKPPPQGYVVDGAASSLNPSTVSVIGPQNQLAGIRAKVSVDLSTTKTNSQQDLKVFLYDASGQRVTNFGTNAPNGEVQATIIVVASITSRASAVLPRVVGAPLPGHQFVAVTVTPLTVVLSGPQDLLNTLDSVLTQTISLNGFDGSRSFTVAVQPPPGVTAAPDHVTVTVTVLTTATPVPGPTATPLPPTPTPTALPTPT